jgi:hypothetical protein
MPMDSDLSSSRRAGSGAFAIGAVLYLCLAGVFPAHAQELEWATSAGGADGDAGSGIATDPRGNSYVTGVFSGTATFGAGEANETVLEAEGDFDVFVAKYARNALYAGPRARAEPAPTAVSSPALVSQPTPEATAT